MIEVSMDIVGVVSYADKEYYERILDCHNSFVTLIRYGLKII